MCVLSGHWRRAYRGTADAEEGAQVHGQVVYGHLLPGDDRQTRCIWLQEVLYRRLVLAGLHYRRGEFHSTNSPQPTRHVACFRVGCDAGWLCCVNMQLAFTVTTQGLPTLRRFRCVQPNALNVRQWFFRRLILKLILFLHRNRFWPLSFYYSSSNTVFWVRQSPFVRLLLLQISLLSLFAESIGYGNIGAFRALRTLRALRPLRAVSRWEGMKVRCNLSVSYSNTID